MNKNVEIAIIMPVYNAEKYLREAIESILRQTYRNFILYIINDGSSDNSEEIILSFKDQRIKYIKNSCNLGIVKTLNKGLALADTKYIARMDADDICDKRRLEIQYNELENDSDLFLLGTAASLINEDGIIVGKIIPPQDDRVIRTSLLFSNVFIHSSIMIRNSILKENNWNYDINHKAVEDYGLWTKIADKYKVKILPLQLMKYRINTEGIMANANKNKEERIKNHSIIYKEYLERNNIKTSNEIIMQYAFFLCGDSLKKLKLMEINQLIYLIKRKIISKENYDTCTFNKILSGISRSYALSTDVSLKNYYKFISENKIFSNIFLEMIKFILSKIKRIGVIKK